MPYHIAYAVNAGSIEPCTRNTQKRVMAVAAFRLWPVTAPARPRRVSSDARGSGSTDYLAPAKFADSTAAIILDRRHRPRGLRRDNRLLTVLCAAKR